MPPKAKRVKNSQSYLQRYWLRESNPGSLAGLQKFVKSRKHVGISEAQKALNKLPTFALFRPQKRKQVRRPVVVFEPNSLIQVDIGDFALLRSSNRNISYLFVGIDVFSKKVYYSTLKHKNISDLAVAVEKLIAETKFKVKNIQSDKEPALYSGKLLAIFKKHGINFYSSKSPLKASVIERFLKTIKIRIHRHFREHNTQNWVSIIDKLIKAYNSEVHSSTGYAPIDVKPKHYSEIAQRLYEKIAQRRPKAPKFKVGQAVRISQKRLKTKTFTKSYDIQWSPEIFYIHSVLTRSPVVSYLLRDSENSILTGSFVDQDLREAPNNESDSG